MKEIKKTVTRVQRKPVSEVIEVVEQPVVKKTTVRRRGPVLVTGGPTLAEAVGSPRVVVDTPVREEEVKITRRRKKAS